MKTTTEELPITKMLEEKIKDNSKISFYSIVIQEIIPQVRQIEEEQLSLSRKEERDSIVGILEEMANYNKDTDRILLLHEAIQRITNQP